MDAEPAENSESDPINLRSFLTEWSSLLTEDDGETRTNLSLFDYMGKQMNGVSIPQDLFAELDTVCGPETMKTSGIFKPSLSAVPADVQLNTLQLQRRELEFRKKDSNYRRKAHDKLKYRHRDGPWRHHENNKESAEGRARVTYPDVLLTVQVYRSYVKPKLLKMEQEFEVLGQQKLTELRDVIHCLSDYVRIGDFSQNPDLPCDVLAKDLYKSGFFFVDGVFYNDKRQEGCRDYSSVIIDWARDPKRSVGPFTSASMADTRFIDLTIKLGQPYLYVHQGNCEHLLIFSDVRVLHADDCQFLDKYPLQTYKSRERRPNCRVCQLYLARWVTFGSPLSPEDPCFFCDTCFRALHYTSDGMIIAKNLQVFPYPHVKPCAV